MRNGGAVALARHAPLVLLTCLAVGLIIGPAGVPVVATGVAAVVLGASAAVAVRGGRAGPAVALLACACLCAGGAWGAARVAATDVPQVRKSGDVAGTVIVDQPPSVTATGIRAQVLVGALRGPAPVPGTHLLLDLPVAARMPQVGQVLRVSGAIGPAAHAGSPEWWWAWLRRQRIAGRIRAHGWTGDGTRGGLVGARDTLRRWAGRNVAAGLHGDIAAMVRGMALGGGLGLGDETAQQVRDAGLWHLLAVSGQNVAVVGIGMAALLGALGASRRARLLGMGGAMLVFCLACDGGASVLRAGLMGGIALAADLGGAPRLRWHALLLALVVMLALDPLSAGDPGMQLSFAAVCGLFVITPPLGQWLKGWLPARAADLMAQSGGAGLATAPVLASGFGTLSTVGLLANLIAVPVAGPVVVIALVGVVGNSLWAPLGVALAWTAAVGAWIVLVVARVASSIPGAVVPMGAWAWPPLALLAAVPPVLWWWLRRVPPDGPAELAEGAWRAGAAVGGPVSRSCGAGPDRSHRRRLGPLGAVLGAAGVVLVAGVGPPGCAPTALPSGPAVRVLDVGQGSAALLRDGSQGDVLVDAGPPGEPPPAVRALQRAGVTALRAIVLSHGAIDHVGGAAAVIDTMPVGRVLLPAPDDRAPALAAVEAAARARGVPVEWVAAGGQVAAGAWNAAVVGPGADDARSAEPNDRSLVVLARAPGLSVLLPGDAEGNVLRDLSLPPVSVLVVPHHGSEDPAIPPVLARLRPVLAVVSAGAGNPFGHPRAQVLAALGQAGARVLRTDEGGDVDLRAGPDGIVIARG